MPYGATTSNQRKKHKSMKKILLTFLAIAAFTAASAQITQIKSTQLPAQARTTIKKAWNGAPTVDAWRNKMGKKVEYKASIENGSTIKFDAQGRWIEMRCYDGVPTSLLPATLLSHIDKYYEGQIIVWAYKSTKRYQIELANGTKLEFNNKGIFQAFL